MMRARSLIIIFILLFGMITVAKVPLAIAMPDGEQIQAEGTIWDGAANNIATPFGPATIRFNASAASLLSLSLGGTWTFEAPAATGRGQIDHNLSGETYLSQSEMRINLAAIQLPKALIGDVDLSISKIGFTDTAKCLEASGTVHSDILERNRNLLRWSGPILSGPIRCDGDDLIMTLQGQDETADIDFVYRLIPNGSYRATARVKTDNPVLKLALSHEAFIEDDGTMTRKFDGYWR